MNQEELLQRYGQDAWDLFEQYIGLDRSARAIARQLKTYGISVTSELDHTPRECQGQRNETSGSCPVPSNSLSFDGLVLVAAGVNPNNRNQVQINVIFAGKTWTLVTGNEQEAKAWLGEESERLVRWDPAFVEDDGLSGLYRKPSLRIPRWIVCWEEIKDLDTVRDRATLDALLNGEAEQVLIT